MTAPASTTIVTIETLLLARHAEAAPDGTLILVGAGLNTMVRSAGSDAQLWLAGTLLVDGSPGAHTARLVYRLRDPEGALATEAELNMTFSAEARIRVPFTIAVPLPAAAPDGLWELSISGKDDLRATSLEVRTDPSQH
jgi:hypothetical protein